MHAQDILSDTPKYVLIDSAVRILPKFRDFRVFKKFRVFNLAFKSDPKAKLILKIGQTGPLIMSCKRLMYCYCS